MATKKVEEQKQGLIINQITIQQLYRNSQDIQSWRNALRQAENVWNPLYKQLYEVYSELLLDAHIYALYKKSIDGIKLSKLEYFEDKKDTSQTNRDFFNGPWFLKLKEYAVQTKFWGHSLVEFLMKDGYIDDVALVPRHHVRPHLGIVSLSSAYEAQGLKYREGAYSTYTLEIKSGELGLLNIAAANTILKRNGLVDFANFVENFGSPIKIFQYDPRNPDAREQTHEVARTMGNSASIVMPKDFSDLRLERGVDAGSKDLHTGFLQVLKEELSVLILGQTSTTQEKSHVGSAEVHEREQNKIINADKLEIEYLFNWVLLPKLIELGYPLSLKGEFKFVESGRLPLGEQIKADVELNKLIPIDPEYFYSKYNVPKPTTKALSQETAEKQARDLILKMFETDEKDPFTQGCC